MRLRLATYNAGLALGVLPRTRERPPLVVRALAELEFRTTLSDHFGVLVEVAL